MSLILSVMRSSWRVSYGSIIAIIFIAFSFLYKSGIALADFKPHKTVGALEPFRRLQKTKLPSLNWS